MGATSKLIVICVIYLGLDMAWSKPANSASLVSSQRAATPPLSPPSSSSSRRSGVVSSWTGDGNWQASARLPSSSQTGGSVHSSTKDLTNNGRNNRRLHKWDKAEEISDESETENDEGENTQSLLASRVNDKMDDSLESSSERDVFVNKEDGNSTDQNETDETSSDEENGEASPTNDPKTSITTWHEEEEQTQDEDKMFQKQKSDASPTTPKGLTTWSAVNGGGGSYIKGQVQKVPSDYTISSILSFNADKATTSVDLVTKDRATFPTTEIPRTTKSNVLTTLPAKKRKPYHKNKKVVLPSKFVKPPLEDITAEAIGTDATHTIYKTRVTDLAQSKVVPDYSYTTKKPMWPYQMPVKPVKKIPTTKRPMAFSRITAKPKNPYVRKPPTPTYSLTLTTPTTTTPSTSTVYHRNPAPLMYPFPSISFTNLGFMDFLRSQIIPRIGLSLISFMAASPLILSMLGASAIGRRKKRSLDSSIDTDQVQFEYVSNKPNMKHLPKFDFSTIKKKLHKLEMIHQKKSQQGNDKQPKKNIATQVAQIVTTLMDTKAFALIKSKFLDTNSDEEAGGVKYRKNL